MSAFRTAVTACAVAGAGLVLAAVMAGPALAAAPAQAATAASAAKTAAPAGTPGAGLVAAASHGRKGAGSGSGTACTTYTLRLGSTYDICFRIDGQGLHIEKATAWMFNNTINYARDLHFEIIGPAGHIANCDQFTIDPLKRSPDCSWEPHADEPAGRYCAKLWQWKGYYIQLGINTCIDVRP